MTNKFSGGEGFQDDGSTWMNREEWDKKRQQETVTLQSGEEKRIPMTEEMTVGNKKTGYRQERLNVYEPIKGKFIQSFEFDNTFEGKTNHYYAVKIELPNGRKLIIKTTSGKFRGQFNAGNFDENDTIEIKRWGEGVNTTWIVTNHTKYDAAAAAMDTPPENKDIDYGPEETDEEVPF